MRHRYAHLVSRVGLVGGGVSLLGWSVGSIAIPSTLEPITGTALPFVGLCALAVGFGALTSLARSAGDDISGGTAPLAAGFALLALAFGAGGGIHTVPALRGLLPIGAGTGILAVAFGVVVLGSVLATESSDLVVATWGRTAVGLATLGLLGWAGSFAVARPDAPRAFLVPTPYAPTLSGPAWVLVAGAMAALAAAPVALQAGMASEDADLAGDGS